MHDEHTSTLKAILNRMLDAHDETLRLAVELADDPRWWAHTEYLRALRAVAREALAEAGDTGTA
jgi:hypothetical protein